MALLHELIAIEEGLKTAAINIEKEAQATFKNKQGHFDGQTRNYKPQTEEDEQKASENRPVIETVNKKLDWVLEHTIRAMNAASSKEATNTAAVANLMLNGKVIAAGVPVTVLVQVENKLASLRALFNEMPTLDATEIWTATDDADIVETAPKIVQSTKKVLVPVIMAPATDKHPAQVKESHKDTVAGTWTTVLKSGRISSLEKARLLKRLDEVIREVKQARQRANSIEVIKLEFAEEIFEYILGRPVKKV